MYTIGIDLGGTNIAAGLVDEMYELVSKKSVPTPHTENAEEIICACAKLADELIAENGLKRRDISYIGAGIPGTIDRKNGAVIYSPNLPFKDTPFAEIFGKYSDLPLYCINDADAAVLGEFTAGAAYRCTNAVLITLGTGVGSGIIIDKQLYTGSNFAGGELGHMVIAAGGRKCGCGREGCWEAYSSASALIKMTQEAMQAHPDSALNAIAEVQGKVTGRTAFTGYLQGDPAAKEVVDTYIYYLAVGLINVINIFQPSVLLLGGGVAGQGRLLIDLLMPYIEKERFSKTKIQTELRLAALGNDAGIIGAAVCEQM